MTSNGTVRSLTILLMTGVFLAATGAALAANAGRTAVVIVDRLNLRTAPGTDAPAIAILERGEVVTVLEENEAWWKVFAADRAGYIIRQDRFLSFAPPSPEGDGAHAGHAVDRPARNLRRRIAQQEQTVAGTVRQEARVLDRLERADRSLAATRVHLARIRADIQPLEDRIDEASEASRALQEKIRQDAAYVKRRLVALYKLKRLGNLQLLASARSMSELQRRRTALDAILDYDRHKLAGYHRKSTLLADLVADLNRSRTQKKALEAQAEEALQAAAREKAEKIRLLEEIRSQKTLRMAALSALKQSARALDQAVAGIEPRPSAKTTAAPSQAPVFENSKGLLKMPVRGKIISLYGAYRHPTYKVTNFNGGIDIRAGLGEPVEAVWQGVVVYSDWFRGYGNLIIVDHGDNYHTLYAHLADRLKAKGDPVEKGEIIGTVGETGPVSDPKLHFQVRHQGKAIDPLEWIKQG